MMAAEHQAAFRALADPSRRKILMHLSGKDMTIGEVASQFDMTRAAVKKHLTILEEGALISVRTSGRERINQLKPEGLKPISDWVSYFSQFWDSRLERLKNTIERNEGANDD